MDRYRSGSRRNPAAAMIAGGNREAGASVMDGADSVPSPERIIELGQGFWSSKALLSAVELRLFTALAAADGGMTCETLRHCLGLHERGARDFFDALVALGLVRRDENGRYANTPETDLYLDRNKPTYVGGFLEMCNATLYACWGGLSDALRTGRAQNGADAAERERFSALYADQARLTMFLKGMTGGSLPVAKAIAARFPWDEYRTLIDIGTAEGCLPVQVAAAYPHLTGGGFDLPPVGPVFEDYTRSHGLSDRLRFHPGDFLRDPLPSADVLVMGRVLHNWDLATKKELLAKAHAALPAGGALLVYDRMIDDERRLNSAGLLASLNMLVMTPGGFDYTGADCVAWMHEAGFREMRVEALAVGHSMVIGRK
jgi:hypothetical protein